MLDKSPEPRTSMLFTRTAIAMALLTTMQPAVSQELFDSGLENRAGLSYSPDGDAAYWAAWNGAWGGDATSTRTIYFSELRDGRWTEPAVAPFSGSFDDDDPFVSPDGRWLYFVSVRPASDGGANSDGDIWRYGLNGDGFLERLAVNSDAAEYSPVVAASGALYFASARQGGIGQGDLYRSAYAGNGFATPEILGPSVNSPTGEWNLWVSEDEREILFEASSRSTNLSVPGDLYYSWKTPAGWVAAIPVSELNTKGSDLLPRVHADTLYYTSAPIGGNAEIVSADWTSLRDDLRANYAPPLLVANRSSHELTIVDLAAGEIKQSLATGAGPHLLSNLDGGRVIATGFGEFPEPHDEPVSARPPFVADLNSRLTLFDIDGGTVLLDISLDDCARPHASWIVGKRGFVTCQDEQAVLEVDLQNGEVVRRYDTMQEGSHVLAFEPRSRTLSASNTDSGSVTLIDIDTGTTRVVKLDGGSEGAAEIGGLFWIGNAWAGSVAVIDPVSAKLVAQTERLCDFPIALSADRRNRVWVACFGSAELLALDRENYEVELRYKLDGQPLHVLVHPDRDVAYLSMPRENAVAEVDLTTGATTRKIRVGIEPDGLRWGR